MDWHKVFLWAWFLVGMFTYWTKRAYFLITGPNPVANDLRQFICRCWMPLLFRAVTDSGIYWATFSPVMLAAGLRYFGLTNSAAMIDGVTQFGFFALFFGLGVDSAVDVAVTKIPWIRDQWPQMPQPLPQPAVVEAQVVKQTTEVTQLQSTTTVVPKETK
jgi:hypothetical protein